MSDKLQLDISGAIATLNISNLPRKNAFDLAMWQALPALIAQAEADKNVRVIVLRGAGQSCFCSGADISEFTSLRATSEGGRAYEKSNVLAFDALAKCSKPTIAAMRQFCMGGGMGLAASCDLRIAEAGTQFGIPAAKLGLGYPPQSMALVVAAVGLQTALDLFATARRFDAGEAFRLGFLARLFSAENFESGVAALADMIAQNAPLTIKAAKAALQYAAGLPHAPSLAACENLAADCFNSSDYSEGRDAFLNKRKPVFTGN